MLIAGLGNLPQIVNGKGIGGTSTHIQIFDTEVNRVRTRWIAAARDSREPTGAMISKSFKVVEFIQYEI